jgi:integrase
MYVTLGPSSDCKRWFFAKFEHQRFHSDECRIEVLQADPARREQRTKYMRELRLQKNFAKREGSKNEPVQKTGEPQVVDGFHYRKRRYQLSTQEVNRGEAAKYERAYRTNLSRGEVGLIAKIAGPGLTVGELLDRLKSNYELHAKATVQNLSHLKRAKADFGAKVSDTLTADDIKTYQLKRQQKSSANASINRTLEILYRAYSLAKLTAPRVERLEEINVRQGFFSREEFDRVLNFLPEDLRDFCLFAFLTGMRKGEIKSLSWSSVSESTIRLRGVDAKTGSPRTIVCTGELREVRERRRQARTVKTFTGVSMAGTIFHRDGLPIGELRKSWATACRSAGCPGKLFHDLRRSGVRNLMRAGVPQNIAMKISGHRTDSTRYDICDEEDLAQAMLSLEKYHKAEQQKVVATVGQ